MNVMNKIVVGFVAVMASGLAWGEEIVIVEQRTDPSTRGGPVLVYEALVNEFQTLSARFDIDAKLGRAWVDIDNVDSEFMTNKFTVNRKVAGLSYDSEAKQVLYQLGTNRIVCGEATNALGKISIRTTGNCPLAVTYEKRTVDQGFRPASQTFAKVTLTPKVAPTQAAER
jgi:hypothetical protein